ncbi:protein FAM216B [Rhinatrema bivittatum]|uniref:protein FAM216B n=1 Tax=Rhinatrema bivittatum TaxID=194408 RepID=UPI001129084F|nr:protein FAM216B [Rhinatrema bivittatum]
MKREKTMEGKSREQADVRPPAKVPHIHVPPSCRNMSLLKDLWPGQKRYLYSIMSVYDTAAGRNLLYRRYQLKLQQQSALGYLTPEEVTHYMSHVNRSGKDPKKEWTPKGAMNLHSRTRNVS